MYNVKKIYDDLYWVGGNDRRLALFENIYPLSRGVSYNSYLLLDQQTVLFDTVDKAVEGVFLENLEHLLGDRTLDYLVIHHMEPDHAATLMTVVDRWPNVKLVGNDKILNLIRQFHGHEPGENWIMVKEGDTLCTGAHTFRFVMAPMVHWPEVMMSFDQTTGTLFSADAFGTFGALGGDIFADRMPIHEWEGEYRRYYTNIVGKYGPLVQAVLKKAGNLDIKMICPLHGPVWRENLTWLLDRYAAWSSYTPEVDGVAVFVGSIYGNTENAAEVLAGMLADRGAKDVRVFNTSNVHLSDLVAEAFRASHLVFASATYNGQIFTPMEELLKDLVVHNLQNRTVALLENGSWGPTAGRQMKELVEKMKNMNIVGDLITVKSALKPEQLPQLEALADAIMANYPMPL